ncbi:hypothetical protein AAVH_27877 [Aphelenchoides avenae]|nr:hypothetical protein AAVH_27877 [Aphelenchus avenae]
MPKHGVSSSNGSDDDAQHGAPEAGAQPGQGVEENENRPRALEAIPEEASASLTDGEHQLNVDMEADPSSDFMRQFAAEGHLNHLGPTCRDSPSVSRR